MKVTIVTPRLLLISAPLHVICTRLTCDDLQADVSISLEEDGRHNTEILRVHFPPEWPGDALALFPSWKEKLETDPSYEILGGAMIDRVEGVAVGQMTLGELTDEAGTVELGYGVNPSYQGRGYATELARGLVQWAAGQPRIRRITSACLEDNIASVRVLEKVGFRRIGHRVDDEGRSILWQYGPEVQR